MNTPSKTGATPTFIAAFNGHDKAIIALATHGADLNTPSEIGATPTFMAACNGHDKALAILAAYGADLDTPFISSSQSLKNFAAKHTQEIILRMDEFIGTKLAAGGDENSIAMSPEDIARVMGHDTVIQFFAARREQLHKTSSLARARPSFLKVKSMMFFNRLDVDGDMGLDF